MAALKRLSAPPIILERHPSLWAALIDFLGTKNAKCNAMLTMASVTRNPTKLSHFSPGRNEKTTANRRYVAPVMGIAIINIIRKKKFLIAPSFSPPIKLKKSARNARRLAHIIIAP